MHASRTHVDRRGLFAAADLLTQGVDGVAQRLEAISDFPAHPGRAGGQLVASALVSVSILWTESITTAPIAP
ncbi:MAG: hypothetical protein ABI604_09750 [Nitrospirota bacterium]